MSSTSFALQSFVVMIVVTLSVGLTCHFLEAGYHASCVTKPGQYCVIFSYDASNFNLESFGALCSRCPKEQMNTCGRLNRTFLENGAILTGSYGCCDKNLCNNVEDWTDELNKCRTKRDTSRPQPPPSAAKEPERSTRKPAAAKSNQQEWNNSIILGLFIMGLLIRLL